MLVPRVLRYPVVAILALTASGVTAVSAAKPPAATPHDEYECRYTDGSIILDGLADEPAWRHAAEIDRFTLPWLKEMARPARFATRAKLLWDRDNLYFFADMDDADLSTTETRDDAQLWNGDVFELFFKPRENQPGYYEFQANPAGAKLDMFLPSRRADGYDRYKGADRFGWQVRVRLRGTLNQDDDKNAKETDGNASGRDHGWSVEGRYSWRDFLRTGGRPEPGDRWRFALCRYDYTRGEKEPELSTSAPLSSNARADFHHYEDYAELRFVGPDPQRATKPWGIERLPPLTTSRVIESPDAPPYRARRAYAYLKLNFPVFVINEPGTTRLWFLDQAAPYGNARLVRTRDKQATTPSEADPFETLLNLDGVAYSIAFHPRFAENGYFYIGINEGPGKKMSRVTRYTLSREGEQTVEPKSALRIIEWESDGHNGAAITFGLDGTLYVTSGDGTSDSDTNLAGQRLDHLLAKVLRVDVDHPDAGRAYSVPKDNPFVGQANVRPETWAYGLRNPWRITTDPRTGQIWVAQNGQDLWEQAYLLERGANYGWSVYEGSHVFYANRTLGPTPHVPPTVEHSHADARSLTGGVVYHGRKLPELVGAYVYGDYSTGKIWGVRHDGKKVVWQKELADTTLAITAFAIDADGELLIADHRGGGEGGLYTLEPSPPTRQAADFPRTLSASGLFVSVKDHRVADGVIPYQVNAPLWSDGAIKERYLALPASGDPKAAPPSIEMTSKGGWNFSDGTVLIKSFAFERRPGDATSRRWIETRFLTRQHGEWAGYSYRWNDDQTDAALVDAAGQVAQFTISTAQGETKRAWRFPSRAECMACHSRAANYVLGLSTVQMNCGNSYNGVVDNQLRVLENLGVLRSAWRDVAVARLRDELRAEKKSEKDIDQLVGQATSAAPPPSGPSPLLPRPPEEFPRLVDPYDPRQPLEARARSYLHANCAHCHIEAGGGNSQFDLDYFRPRDQGKYVDIKPLHHTFAIADVRIVAPGHPERSTLLHRMSIRGAGQMPQLATGVVDDRAVELIREWIRSLDTK